MRVPCNWCDRDVRAEDVQTIEVTNPITGPGVAKRACVDCQRAEGLVPLAAYTGRRDAPPTAPRRTA